MKPVIVISERDNVATALESLDVGRVIDGPVPFTVREAIPRGHKVSRRAILAGESVIKYGDAIGVATTAIAPGVHVHTHNLSSTRGRGDLARPEPAADAPRIAEPAGDRGNP